MQVFIVQEHEPGGNWVYHGVFSSMEKAEKYISRFHIEIAAGLEIVKDTVDRKVN